MSDDKVNVNVGVTLPEGNNAIYNVGLSPLFSNRSGRGPGTGAEESLVFRGSDVFYWSKNASSIDMAFYLIANANTIFPNRNWVRYQPFSLRCLVFTTNS